MTTGTTTSTLLRRLALPFAAVVMLAIPGAYAEERPVIMTTKASADEIRSQVAAALEQSTSHLSFSDVKGNSYIVPTANLGYIELGTEELRRVGFVA